MHMRGTDKFVHEKVEPGRYERHAKAHAERTRRAHADKLDPRVKSDGTRKDGETDLTAETAGDSAVDAPTHRDSTAR